MKRILAVLLCLLSAYGMMAQERKLQHRPYIDQRRFHYGFLFGVHMQDLELKNNGYVDPETGEQWYADVDNYSPGFSVGVLGEMRLNTYLSLRLVPTLHFGQKHVSFHEQTTGQDSTQNIKSTYISVPLMNPLDCYIEVGMGCDIYLPFFKLIPELKFCFGLADILQKNRNDLIDNSLRKFTNSLDGASSKMIVLTLYFE